MKKAGQIEQLGIPTLGVVSANVSRMRHFVQRETNIRRCMAIFFVTILGWLIRGAYREKGIKI